MTGIVEKATLKRNRGEEFSKSKKELISLEVGHNELLFVNLCEFIKGTYNKFLHGNHLIRNIY